MSSKVSESIQQVSIMEYAPRIPARGGVTRIRQFDGTSRRTSDWDGLRRDDQLWFPAGDCLVYFYMQYTSQRNASLRMPLEAIHELGCTYLSEQCLRTRSLCENSSSERTYTRLRNDSDPEAAKYELYVPAPSDATREQAFSYHLTTRNLLAYAVGAPLVGEKLSIALTDLWRRILQWKMAIRPSDFTSYLEKQGYLDFTENTEHSLACLKFAEEARLRDVWIDSFVHCVGMHPRLDLSPEFASLSKGTAALITRASLEMDLNIGRVIRAVGSFLEEDFGLENLGLTRSSRDHLDYFRSFLHSFYVNKFGYFPPSPTNPWNKRPWTSMHSDFQHLYDYLADNQSSSDWTSNRSLAGGICVIQNVQSFDLRHGYSPLQHPLPLLPETPVKPKSITVSHKGLKPLAARYRLGYSNEPKVTPSQRLAAATNPAKAETMRCPLVQEYQRFERQVSDSKLDIVEARKIRWLLIYGVLQMLNSVITAPAEVRDPETASYPLCVSTVGCPPWECEVVGRNSEITEPPQRSNEKMLVLPTLNELEGRTSRISIHPDCEADCAEDFFASLGVTRQDSARSFSTPSSPLKRTASLRNSMHFGVQALQKSVVGSLSRRASIRNSLILDVKKSQSACDILVEACATEEPASTEPSSPVIVVDSSNLLVPRTSNQWSAFDFGFVVEQAPEPEQDHVESDLGSKPIAQNIPEEALASPCDSNFTASSDESSNADSNRSSYIAEPIESPTTDLSSWDGGSRRGSTASESTVHADPKKQLCYQPSNPNMRQKGSLIHAGHYVPKGMVAKSSSTGSESSADIPLSYVRPTNARVAKERRTRHRRQSSSLDGLTDYGIVLRATNVW